MKLLITVVTHNRLAYTKKCLRSLNETLMSDSMDESDDYYVVVVDNASSDGTQEWLSENGEFGGPGGSPEWFDGIGDGDFGGVHFYDHLILSKLNAYPGAACNRGWMVGLVKFPEATHLCRIDNDCLMLPGWFDEVKKTFEGFEALGQFGLIEMSDAEEFSYQVVEVDGAKINVGPSNIGGPNVIRRDLWDKGLRYDESPWQSFGGPTAQEDVKLSLAVQAMGYTFGNTVEDIVTEMSFGNTDDFYDYYARTFAQRGHGVPARTKDGELIESGSSDRDHI